MHTHTEELVLIICLVITVHLRDRLLENFRHRLNINPLSHLLSAAAGIMCILTAPHVLPPPPLHTQHTTPTITAKPKEGETKKETIQERENNRLLGWGIHHFLAITLTVIVKRRGKEREKGPRGNVRENREKENGKEKEREKRNRMLTLTHIDKAPLPLCLVTTLLLTPLRSSRPGLIPSLSNNNNNSSPFPPPQQPSTRYSFSFRPSRSCRLSNLLHSSNRVKSHQLSCREMEQWRST